MKFSQLPSIPQDPIIEVYEDYLANKNPKKENLSIGMYFDEAGKLVQFDAVAKAALEVSKENITKSYLPIPGHPGFRKAINELTFGKDNPLVTEDRIACIQTLAASCGLRLIAEFAYRELGCRRVFISNPTWDNHHLFFANAGFETLTYHHYDRNTFGIDFAKTYADLESSLRENDVVLLHAVCHNPTGADYTREQWDKLNQLFAERKVLAVFDMAYLGYGRGLDEDRYCLLSAQKYLDQYVNIVSCSKSFALYAERIGALQLVCKDAHQAVVVTSVLANLVRSIYSTPIMHGALVVEKVLKTPELYQEWLSQLDAARERLRENRRLFVAELKKQGIEGYDYVLEQNGFFSFLPLTPEQVIRLRKEHAVYILESGRINFAGINPSNIDYIASSIAQVVKES